MTMTSGNGAAALEPLVIVKNTFIHVDIEAGETPKARSFSTPPSTRTTSMSTLQQCPSDPESDDSDAHGAGALVPAAGLGGAAARNDWGRQSSGVAAGGCRLSSHARPYQPAATACQIVPVPIVDPVAFYEDMLGRFVVTVATAMSDYTKIETGIQPVEGNKGWLLDTWLAATDAKYVGPVLRHTKKALLRAAEESTHVYVLGYRGSPFRATEHGFEATLGVMQDPNQACWNLYEDPNQACWNLYEAGYCQRRMCCRWQHPICQKLLYIAVRPWPRRRGVS